MIQRVRILDITLRGHTHIFWNPQCFLHIKAKAIASANTNAGGHKVDKTTASAFQAQGRDVTSVSPVATAWDLLWKAGFTPWDLKGVTPVISHLLEKNKIPEGLALVPGCGLGYDVVAMASPTRHVVGLDFSNTALEQAKRLATLSPNSEFAEFLDADFFTYVPSMKFDLIFDYTFFCSIDPNLRPEWAKKMAELLAVDGELITLMYPLGDKRECPSAVSLIDYEKVLRPWAFKVSSIEVNIPSVPSRKGCESLVRWGRMAANF